MKEKLNNILKNVVLFLVIFLAINYLMQSCMSEEEAIQENAGNIVFVTTKNEYSRTKTVTLEITNNTEESITIKNECPGEPFNVYRYENNEWIQKTANPEIDCSEAQDATLEPGDKTMVMYDNWNYALFGETGRYKIEFQISSEADDPTQEDALDNGTEDSADASESVNQTTKIIQSNEFLVKEEGIFKKLWMGIFYRPIYNGLIWLTKVLPAHSLGWAIIILTMIIRTILLAPSQKSMKAQRKMQEVQPRLEKIKEKYKGDQQRIAAETMAIWKDAKVNPFGSCLPLLLQFPFLIAVFYVVKGGLNPDNTHLLYTAYENFSLHDIQTNFLGILELTKVNMYVLPLIIGGLQFTQMRLAMARKEKKKDKKDNEKKPKNEMAMASNTMMYVMPVMIAVFTASLPAGVGLYWGTSTLYGIVQQYFVNKGKSKSPDEPIVKVIKNT